MDCFSRIKGFGEELDSNTPADILKEFETYLLCLIENLYSYFLNGLYENIKKNVML